MNITLTVSVGEAIDKYSILSIKENEIKDVEKLKSIHEEMDLIYPQIKEVMEKHDYHYQCLLHINKEIWDLSEKVRDDHLTIDYKNTLFLETFYKNDARFRIKNKLNKLSLSVLNEQKSYPSNNIIFAPLPNILDYQEKNHYIRYMALCYDAVVLLTTVDTFNNVKQLFSNDPHIMVTNDVDKVGNDLNIINEPIPNLLNTYNFSFEKSIHYIVSGRLGDFVHLLYVVMCKHKETGLKGNIYITDDLSFGGDSFSCPLQQTYKELYDIVIQQTYVETFSMYKGEPIDINLNHFRNSPVLFSQSWLKILSTSFNFKMLEEPWILCEKDEQYANTVLIHQSIHGTRKVDAFLPILENIIKNNKCVFITCNVAEYAHFKLKHLVSLLLKPNLQDMFIAINSCKFFIGNQSSPFAMAMSMFKPGIIQNTEGSFYTHPHYPDLHWITPYYNNLDKIKLLNM